MIMLANLVYFLSQIDTTQDTSETDVPLVRCRVEFVREHLRPTIKLRSRTWQNML